MAQPLGLSKDGYEVQFATNHLGHATLIKQLLPIMLTTAEQPEADVRTIFLSSVGWRFRPNGGIQFLGLNTMQDFGILGSWRRYGQSKLTNIVYTTELAHRYPNITTVSVHPGVVKPDLVGNLGLVMQSFRIRRKFRRRAKPIMGSYGIKEGNYREWCRLHASRDSEQF